MCMRSESVWFEMLFLLCYWDIERVTERGIGWVWLLWGWYIIVRFFFGSKVYLVWTFFTRPSRSTWPAAYCSITSFTSYGFKASLNLRRAVKYFIWWSMRGGHHHSIVQLFGIMGWMDCGWRWCVCLVKWENIVLCIRGMDPIEERKGQTEFEVNRYRGQFRETKKNI